MRHQNMQYNPNSSSLHDWLEQERIVKERLDAGVGCGFLPAENIREKTGLEYLNAILLGKAPYSTISRTMSFILLEVEKGRVLFQGNPGAEFLNTMGSVHGGWFATLLDAALGCAVHTVLPSGRGYTTISLSMNIVKSITPKLTRVRAEGKVIHAGKRMMTAEGRLFDHNGILYAHAIASCLTFDIPVP